MTTISVKDHMTLFAALGFWATGNYSIVRGRTSSRPDQTVEQVNRDERANVLRLQSAAEIAALRYLDYPSVIYAGNIAAGCPAPACSNRRTRSPRSTAPRSPMSPRCWRR